MVWLILFLIPAGLLTLGVLITDINNWNRYNDIVRRREADPDGLHLPDDRLRENIFSQWLLVKFLGIHWGIGRYFGNCFSPAVVLTVNKASVNLTIRTRFHLETSINFGWSWSVRTKSYTTRLPRFWWSSTHIARWFGEQQEAPHGMVWKYKGILGNHWDV